MSVADARRQGLTGAQWRDTDLIRVTRGVKSTDEPETLADRCTAFALALPDDVVFSHLTAALLWGLPLPRWAKDVLDLDVMRTSSHPPVERRGCRGHRGLEGRSTRTVAGIRVTSLIDTWIDLAEISQPRALTVDDLTVVADEILMRLAQSVDVLPGEEEWQAVARHDQDREFDPRPDRRDRLQAALAIRVRPRGARRLRAALDQARVGSRSPMETRTRLLLVRRGFPEPGLNVTITGPEGRLLEGDLVWRERRVIGEYQGEHHGGRRQCSVDVARRNLAEDDGWTVVEIWAEDLYATTRRRRLLLRLADKLGLDRSDLDLS